MKIKSIILATGLILIFASCGKKQSSTTGWDYNNPKNGGFEVDTRYQEQITGPGLVFIEGGAFAMGRVEQDVFYDWNNISKKITVSSFYLDKTEVKNVDYLEYLHWLKRVYGGTYPEVYQEALPDTLVWRNKTGENENFVNNYLRHPAYKNYPVVGVSWEQANNYCSWRTDRVNERILINAGILEEDNEQTDDNTFNTQAYLSGQYEGIIARNGKGNLKNLNPMTGEDRRQVRREDGILLPNYRLPTEAEWEFAALGYVGNTNEENISERKIYPWNGSGVRNSSRKNQGQIMANFKRGRGDNMGVSGNLNDNADVTGPVESYWPNDYGLYNMAGNVSEWVADVYRPIIEQTATSDHRAYRGNVFKTQKRDEDGNIAEKNELGKIDMVDVDPSTNIYRRNYKQADNINYLDGDIESQMEYSTNNTEEKSSKDKSKVDIDKRNKNQGSDEDGRNTGNSNEMYDYGNTTLVTDKTRVYKGGSWKDRAYWLNPGTRRFLDQERSADDIGFRCAMDRVGSPVSRLKENQRREVDYSKKKL